ncbi:hypothetical protein [Brevundimonas poindexterae]|uniref:hypothetical protein n=1 Tax=Brevundimonas poindexterae TaxID=74325 RepID=UPI001CFDAC0A|nr:hypothetical protein [Brevundimonas poindexterae]
MLGLALAATLAALSPCDAPVGTSMLLDTDARIIVIGELHGTAEVPAAFAEMVCEAAQRGPVTVALELPQGMQPEMDAFLAAEDDAAALLALEGTPFLDPTMIDGRTSLAMVAMLNRIRALRAEGLDVTIHLFQPSSGRPAGFVQSWYELDMAKALSEGIYARPEARVLALVGNLHASKTAIDDMPHVGLPAFAHFRPAEVFSLQVMWQGGEAWTCNPECGSHAYPSAHDASARGVILEPDDEGAYDGLLAVGPTTASPPVQAE